MREALEGASERRACVLLQVPRSAARPSSTRKSFAPVSDDLVERIAFLIQSFPTYGYRRLWALLRKRHGMKVNRPGRLQGTQGEGVDGPSENLDAEAKGQAQQQRNREVLLVLVCWQSLC